MTAGVQERADWLERRRSGIGASDVAGILGLSNWASPWSSWADKTGLLPIDEGLGDDDPREFGQRAEAMIGPWFHDRTGLHVAGEQTELKSKSSPHHMATLDGFVTDTEPPIGLAELWELGVYRDVEGVLEIKTDYGRPWDEVPAHYQAQGQWQMHVADLDRAWFAVLHSRRFRVYELERDQADIDFMVDKVDEFWHDHVRAGVAPPIDGHDATLAALASIYPKHVPKSTTPIDDVAGALRLLVEAKAAKKEAEQSADAAAAVLRWSIGDNYEGTIGGQRAVTLGNQTRKTTCKHCGETDESAPFRVLRPAKEFTE